MAARMASGEHQRVSATLATCVFDDRFSGPIANGGVTSGFAATHEFWSLAQITDRHCASGEDVRGEKETTQEAGTESQEYIMRASLYARESVATTMSWATASAPRAGLHELRNYLKTPSWESG